MARQPPSASSAPPTSGPAAAASGSVAADEPESAGEFSRRREFAQERNSVREDERAGYRLLDAEKN